jgi:hypothetical protein
VRIELTEADEGRKEEGREKKKLCGKVERRGFLYEREKKSFTAMEGQTKEGNLKRVWLGFGSLGLHMSLDHTYPSYPSLTFAPPSDLYFHAIQTLQLILASYYSYDSDYDERLLRR